MALGIKSTSGRIQPIQVHQDSKGPQKSNKGGFVFVLSAFLTASVIIIAVAGAAFYFIVHNNINGLGEQYRKQIHGIPLLKLALPAVADPEDPKYLTEEELKEGYNTLREKRNELTKALEEANQKILGLQKVSDENSSIKAQDEIIKADADAQKAQLNKERALLEEDWKKVNELIASGNKTAFKDYFEKVDKETANKIYTEIIQEQKVSDELKQTIQIYESMDSVSAAKIFEQMGKQKISLISDIIKNMKKDVAAEVLAGMDPAFASSITEKLTSMVSQ